MQNCKPKSPVRYYSIKDIHGITKSFVNSYGKLAWCNFLQTFRPIESFENYVSSTLPYLWRKHKNGEQIDEEVITAEFIRWIEPEKFEEEVIKHPQEYKEIIEIIIEFLYSAEREYYSGFFGFIRSLKKGKKIRNQNIYKKLI